MLTDSIFGGQVIYSDSDNELVYEEFEDLDMKMIFYLIKILILPWKLFLSISE